MKAVYVPVSAKAQVVDLDPTLENLQDIVKGYIEIVYPFSFAPTICIVCNEEGKLQNMLPNRPILDDNLEPVDYIAGDFLVLETDINACEFKSMPVELAELFAQYFNSFNVTIIKKEYDFH